MYVAIFWMLSVFLVVPLSTTFNIERGSPGNTCFSICVCMYACVLYSYIEKEKAEAEAAPKKAAQTFKNGFNVM